MIVGLDDVDVQLAFRGRQKDSLVDFELCGGQKEEGIRSYKSQARIRQGDEDDGGVERSLSSLTSPTRLKTVASGRIVDLSYGPTFSTPVPNS